MVRCEKCSGYFKTKSAYLSHRGSLLCSVGSDVLRMAKKGYLRTLRPITLRRAGVSVEQALGRYVPGAKGRKARAAKAWYAPVWAVLATRGNSTVVQNNLKELLQCPRERKLLVVESLLGGRVGFEQYYRIAAESFLILEEEAV